MIAAKLGQLKTREKIGLVIAVLCVALVLIDRLAVQTVIRQINRIEDEINAEIENLERNHAFLAAEPVVNDRYEKLRPRLGAAPTPAAAADRLKGRIDELARRHGLSIQAMRDRPAADEEAGLKLAVEIGRFEADIEALIAFLCAVQEAPEVWQIARLNVAPDNAGRLNGAMVIAQLTEIAAGE